MFDNFLNKNTKILSQIDSVYSDIQTTVAKNNNKKDVVAWGYLFKDIWYGLHSELKWTHYHLDRKSKTRKFMEKIFPSIKETAALKLAMLAKVFPSLKYLAKKEPLFTQCPILQKDSNLSLTFPPNTITYKTIYGFDLCATGLDIQYTLITGHYHVELSETLLMLRSLQHIDAFIDVGANIGFYSLLMAQESEKKIPVFACEPGTENLKNMSKAIKINGMEKAITVLPFALGEETGKAELYLASRCAGDNTMSPTAGRDVCGSETVDVKTLDNVITQFNLKRKNCFIKIDVEGHEEMVLKGGKELLNSEFKPIILIEAWPESKIHPKNNHIFVINFLESCGYNIFSIFPAQNKKGPLVDFDTKHPTKNLPPTANYLAIPKNKMDLLKILNAPVDMRVFSSTEALISVKKYVDGSYSQLQNRLNE